MRRLLNVDYIDRISVQAVSRALIPDTIERLSSLVAGGRRVVFTHLNNTNPVLDPDSGERLGALTVGVDPSMLEHSM